MHSIVCRDFFAGAFGVRGATLRMTPRPSVLSAVSGV